MLSYTVSEHAHAEKDVEQRHNKQDGVEPVEEATMAWEQAGCVLYAHPAFHPAFDEVASLRGDGAEDGEREQGERALARIEEGVEGEHRGNATSETTHRALPRLPGTDPWRHGPPAHQPADRVRARVRLHD